MRLSKIVYTTGGSLLKLAICGVSTDDFGYEEHTALLLELECQVALVKGTLSEGVTALHRASYYGSAVVSNALL